MIEILKQIGKGVINGFPLVQSIIRNIKGVRGTRKEILPNPTVENPDQTDKKPFNVIALISEVGTFVLILAFIFHKITFEDFKNLLETLKN